MLLWAAGGSNGGKMIVSRVFGFTHLRITEEMKPSDIFFYKPDVSVCTREKTDSR